MTWHWHATRTYWPYESYGPIIW